VPIDQGFWADEAELLFDSIYDSMLANIYQAYANGFDALGDQLPVGLDLELINLEAQQFAQNYTTILSGAITSTTQTIVQDKVSQWLGSGEGLGVLMDSLMPWFTETRAEMIAITETTRAYAEGNIKAWQASGVVEGKRKD